MVLHGGERAGESGVRCVCPRALFPYASLHQAAMRAIRWCSQTDSFGMKLMGCLHSSFINYRLLSLREDED